MAEENKQGASADSGPTVDRIPKEELSQETLQEKARPPKRSEPLSVPLKALAGGEGTERNPYLLPGYDQAYLSCLSLESPLATQVTHTQHFIISHFSSLHIPLLTISN